MSRLTGADVAASTDLTGNAALSGDWNPEFDTRNIETPEIFEPWAVVAYNSILDAPVIDLPDSPVAYTENDTPTAIAPALTITDADGASDTLDGARVAIANNFNVSQNQLSIQGQSGTIGGINWSYNINQGILTFSGVLLPTALMSPRYARSPTLTPAKILPPPSATSSSALVARLLIRQTSTSTSSSLILVFLGRLRETRLPLAITSDCKGICYDYL